MKKEKDLEWCYIEKKISSLRWLKFLTDPGLYSIFASVAMEWVEEIGAVMKNNFILREKNFTDRILFRAQ